MPLFWLNYRHPHGRFAGAVVIESSALVSARMEAAVYGLNDRLEFASGHELDQESALKVPTDMLGRQSRTYQEGEVSHERMRARTRLLQALHSKDPEAIKQAKADAIKSGYSAEAVGHIGRTPSDVFLFSKLPEADQEAILRQASPTEFDRYVTHAKKKIRAPMREEHAGAATEKPAVPAPSSAPATVAPAPRSATPPPSPRPTLPPEIIERRRLCRRPRLCWWRLR